MRFAITFVLLLGILCADARVVELEDREGRKITVDVIALRDGILTFRRVDSASLHHFPISELASHSAHHLHEQMTRDLTPALSVTMLERSRKTDTNWRTYWGSYDKTTHLARSFNVQVHSTSAFYKEVYVYIYWINGKDISYSVWEAEVGSGKKFETVTEASGKQRNEYYSLSGARYVTGTDVVEPVIVVKDRQGKVLTSWANLKNLQDSVLAATGNDKPNRAKRYEPE